MRHLGKALTVLCTCVFAQPVATGDTFLLSTGGQIEGQLLNPDESPRATYVIKTNSGGRVTLDRTQVKKVLTTRSDRQEYQRIRPQFADTIEGQWEAGQWCFKRQLLPEYRKHLQRVIELDGDHAQARRALGYRPYKGTWKTQKEIMAENGYVPYRRGYRSAQEIELMEEQRKVEVAQKDWAQKLKRWRGWLSTNRWQLGRQNILALEDPNAVPGLIDALASKDSEQAKILYIEALANIGTRDAIEALAVCAFGSVNEEIWQTCLDYLVKAKHPQVTAYFVGKLHDKDNRKVHRAAKCLHRLQDPSAVGPLIGSLITVHTYQIITSRPSGGMSATFSPNGGGGGLGVGGGGPKRFDRSHTNQPVLDALVSITGQNFSFDQQAWKFWFASQKKAESLDARRD